MATIWNGWYWHLGLASLLAMGGAIASGNCAHAQVTPDATLGAESSVVTPTNVNGIPSEQIDGGATRGANLFHSFDEFSIPTGGEAYFNNATDIQNIIGRVTGGSISNIDGLLRANGTANLFLLNPNGIIFGPNASLNIGGSFLGSTASSLNFADGTQFSATATTTTPLLTVSVPIGLQYGANPGRIQVQGNGEGTRAFDAPIIDTTVGLRVQPNQTLAIVGGDIGLLGGTLKTAGGRIELGSVAGPGLVKLTPIDSGWALGYEGVSAFGDIQLSGAATVDASGAGGGDIQVQGRRVTLTNGSEIVVNNLGAEPGGTLSVSASDVVEVIGKSADGQGPSALFAEAEGSGNAGDLTITTGRLTVRDGAEVSTTTYGPGAGGTLSVSASDVVEVIGTSVDGQGPSALFAEAEGSGNAGDLTITTGRLTVRDGAQVATGTYGPGAGGTLSVSASDVVEVIGTSADGRIASGLYAETQGDGNAGDLTITTGRLTVRDGAEVSASILGIGAGGTLSVSASDVVEVIGRSADGLFASGLYAETQGDGNAGDLTITTGRLTVRDGAEVSITTYGPGAGGTLSVSASDVVEVIGTSADGQGPSALFAEAEGSGNAGDLTITTGRLTVRDGAQVATGTYGPGAGGTLSVTASDVVELIGTSADGRIVSGLYAETSGDGNAGNLTIATGRLTVRDRAEVSVSSQGSGSAGNLEVGARFISLDNQAQLTAETASGSGGNITLSVQDLLRMRNNSLISAEARGTGGNSGNIDINPEFLVAVPSENSDIVASANQGGNIEITASGIFGVQFRESVTPESDITATGTVTFNTLDVDPSQGLVELPAELVDVSNQIAQGCPDAVRRGESKFIITGRGGLPPSPKEPLRGDNTLVEWVTLDSDVENRSDATPDTNLTIESAPTTIVEASGWVKGPNGEVTLVATAPTATDIPWLPESSCNAPPTSS